MKVTGFLSLAFAALASAVPAGQTTSKGVSQLAKFDDLTAVPGISQINPVGIYKGINYRSFNVLQNGVLGAAQVSGVKAQSGSQVAANSITGTVLTGSPALIPASPYKSFNLQSLYFGCVVNSAVSVSGVPQQCTVAFTSYLPGSNVAYQTINQQFDPSNAVLSKMTQVTFPKSWQKMGRVSISIVQATTTSPLAALFLDNVQYTLFK
ncbi:uncharacterized protein LTR77_004901 [Saxophila tyrrhenica]|uniref:Uncharacterized protein n=1 Tax=Saxophila tyrrhenica TaxID=1690608 RepID=A0AAV9PCU1_9PEZI|nr:hypothetical protein LTR77_004901 [Saxophila tyrrhenica]